MSATGHPSFARHWQTHLDHVVRWGCDRGQHLPRVMRGTIHSPPAGERCIRLCMLCGLGAATLYEVASAGGLAALIIDVPRIVAGRSGGQPFGMAGRLPASVTGRARRWSEACRRAGSDALNAWFD